MLSAPMTTFGIVPGKVTDIFLIHAHLDHSGGLLTEEGKRDFTNATLYIFITEHLFWSPTLVEIETVSPELPAFLSNGLSRSTPKLLPRMKTAWS